MNRGDVVEVNWPYSDLSGMKVRPAVVVRSDFLTGLIDDTVLVKITGTAYGVPGTEVLLDPVVETSSGLSKVCYACCYAILTRDEAVIGRVVGSLSLAAMQEIEKCLKAVLEIP
jgi:mRNA-degrading endonuclease toxin of MazEF toxin-antitoxin module